MNEISQFLIRRTAAPEEPPGLPFTGVAGLEEPPGLRDYWRVIKKHRRTIATFFLVMVISAAIFVFTTTPLYTAKATIMIERRNPQVVNIQQVLSESIANDPEYYQSQYEILKSRSLAAEVIKGQGLDKNPLFTGQKAELNQQESTGLSSPQVPKAAADDSSINPSLIDTYKGRLQIEPLPRTRLVYIGFDSSDPELSASIANAHAHAYVSQGLKLRAQANQEAQKFLETKLAELKTRVEESEKALNDFRRGKGILSLTDKENIVVERLADLNKRLTEAEAERIGLEAQAHLIKKRDYDSLPAVLSHSLIQGLKGQVVQLDAEHAKLSSQFLPGYPRLAQLKAQLEEAKSRLAHEIKTVVEGINSAYFAAAGKERELRAQMNKQKAETLELKDAAVQYVILAREVDTNKQLYDSVLGRLKEIGVAAEMRSSNVSIIDAAEVPRVPSWPRKNLSLLIGAFVGLIGGLGLAFFFEYLDNTMRNPEEVERYLRLPILSVVPDFFSLPKAQAQGKLPLVSQAGRIAPSICVPAKSQTSSKLRFAVITETYRKLRTSIFLSRPGMPPKTILFTSGISSEGKTITVANTAIVLAQLGHQVLVVDADLRRPACHKALRVQNGPGLADVLAGLTDLEPAIKTTAVPNLSLLNCGSIPPNPSELIGSKKMEETLRTLKTRYDFVLLDSPPVIPVSDAVDLSTMVDGVVLVVRGQQTPKHLAKAAVAQLNNSHSTILGVVLNRIDIRSADYAEYYRYYVSDYYPSVELA
jgi:succinoglycan biosynthesis transport protein ExoP